MANAQLQVFLDTFERECATTIKVLRAFPEEKGDTRPNAKAKTARELSFIFAQEQGLTMRVLSNAPGSGGAPAYPATIAESISAFEEEKGKLVEALKALSDEQLTSGTVKFFVAPKQMGDIPTMDFLWFILFDQIHHRGQFSTYLRLADAKVPSIYGPTSDEPWF